jgi:N-acetylglucosaminyl-diphospho-decaprenol L-rhamnosyltransferase
MSAEAQIQNATSVRVVIVNYRTANLTIDCLRSLQSEVQMMPNIQVTVVDNNSEDGSAEKIAAAIAQENWQSWVTFMPLEINGGYAMGNNAAIRPVLASDTPPDYVLLLNPDTVIRPKAVLHLVEFMDAHPDVGIAGSRLEDLDGTPQFSSFHFPSIWTELDNGLRLGIVTQLLAPWVVSPAEFETAYETGWVAGASMMIRPAVFDAIGLMDEDYFLYYEEVDFCLMARRAGWPCWYVPESRVVHFVGQSSGVTDTKRKPKRMPTYWFDSRRRFFIKNYGWLYTMLTELVWMLGFSLWRVRRVLQRKPDEDPPNLLADFFNNSSLVKGGQL